MNPGLFLLLFYFFFQIIKKINTICLTFGFLHENQFQRLERITKRQTKLIQFCNNLKEQIKQTEYCKIVVQNNPHACRDTTKKISNDRIKYIKPWIIKYMDRKLADVTV